MKIFFTGGSGFVGQNMIPELIQSGHEVFGLARSNNAAKKVEEVGGLPVMDDLTKLATNTIKALKKCDAVVHSAAYMDFTYEKEKFYAINVDATKKLVQLAKENGVQKFIYISAAPVIGGSPVVNVTEANADKTMPTALYPKTKAIAEKAVLAANNSTFKTISLRPPAIWGPNNHHYEEIIDRVKAGQWAWIGGGHQILSTVHIKNLSAAVVAALEKGNGGDAYFITDGDRRSMRTTFSAIIKAYGQDPGKREIPLGIASALASMGEFTWKLFGRTSRPPVPPIALRLMAREFSVSDAKARKELGYQNVISFEEGVKEMMNDK